MPAINMKAPAQAVSDVNLSSAGVAVICDPLSGPTGSPLDNDESGNLSTGAMSTGIGLGCNHVIDTISGSGFTDNVTPGVTMPDGTTAATTAKLIYIGGGHSDAASGGIAATTPYDAQPILVFGNGLLRDAGSAPAYTGHGSKLVTATGTVANGSVVETGYTNRSGQTIYSGQSVFGAQTAASPAVTPDYLTPDIVGDLTPAVTSPATAVQTYTSTENNVTWSLDGGTDVALFSMNATTGALTFQSASVAGTYEVIIRATGTFKHQDALVTVTVS